MIIHEITARLRRWEAINRLLNSSLVQNALVGTSQTLQTILRQIIEVARFTNVSVLILGESGTGKELLANLIHTLDNHTDKGELIILDCTTIVPELSGSEFLVMNEERLQAPHLQGMEYSHLRMAARFFWMKWANYL